MITETIATVLAQTRRADQIIVVDDGSTDDTSSVLAGFGDQIQVISIRNSGDLVARNTGLRAATSELVAFCDSDDLWKPEFLAEMVFFWESGNHPLCAYSDFHHVRDGRWEEVSKFSSAPAGYWDDLESLEGAHFLFRAPTFRSLLSFQPFFCSCMIVDRERFVSVGGWDEGVSRSVGCDFATTLRIGEHPPIGVLQKPLVGIRKHAGNFSGDVQKMNLGDAHVLEYVLATRPTLAPYAAEIRASINDRRLDAFDTAFARGDFAAVKSISELLPSGWYGLRHHVKRTIAASPESLRELGWKLTTEPSPQGDLS
jgi:glycosyltransferase involved in cell wall biosynthesis